MRLLLLFLPLLLFLSSCETTSEPFPPPGENGDESAIVNAFPELSFTRPLDIQNAGDGTDRLFVVEQEGVISVFSNDPEAQDAEVFLDIRERVNDGANEQGLLGLAFHPDFESNRYVYVNYTAYGPSRTVISRFEVSSNDPNRADAGSEVELLSYNQPQGNHNGGHLAFGPDGYLYIASGDGGGGGDPGNNAQDRTNLLGAILRIDVDNPQNGNQYGIPADNPFVNNNEGFREEIFAYGLRNPWRFSFDAETEVLWAADVGQSDREVIHIIENGRNYGWNIVEGSICYPPGSSCETDGLEMPVYEYDHSQGDRSITGGFVYRGSAYPQLYGYYIYGDFISGRIWALDISDTENPSNTEIYNANFNIPSFGVDEQNEIYIAGFDGTIYLLGSGAAEAL
ncbi:glucose sorbosone dehydrogenase [Rhodohalobacter sp. SW132]|uniref:PQQ-dependent sugar dehydrogenase n=1 Tax=Rhodohalobacter sp. SW132 TaxID=2293433 RepID=UPI000E24F226|nr:PQQ-dependent sugar dehydrogenase [Rhodohalobacter sp. SW132]REL37862.1 glucose sorbosone dehydrogenase [Rhodohalobacter sp. SW132]